MEPLARKEMAVEQQQRDFDRDLAERINTFGYLEVLQSLSMTSI